MKINRWALAMVMVVSAPAWSCKMLPDERSMEQKVAASEQAFIGKVVQVNDKTVHFEVQESDWFKGKAAQEKGRWVQRVSVGDTSCHHRYSVGQTWFFLGNHMGSGSVLMQHDGKSIPEALALVNQWRENRKK